MTIPDIKELDRLVQVLTKSTNILERKIEADEENRRFIQAVLSSVTSDMIDMKSRLNDLTREHNDTSISCAGSLIEATKEAAEVRQLFVSLTENLPCLASNSNGLLHEVVNADLRQMVSHADIFLILDSETKVSIVSESTCKILGLSRGEILGKVWIDSFVPPEDAIELKRELKLWETDHKTHIFHHKNKVICKNRTIMVNWKNSLIRDKGNVLIGFLSVGEIEK